MLKYPIKSILHFCLVSFFFLAIPNCPANVALRPIHSVIYHTPTAKSDKKEQRQLRKKVKSFFKKHKKELGLFTGFLGLFSLLGWRRKMKKRKKAMSAGESGIGGCGAVILGFIGIGLIMWLFELLFSNVWVGLGISLGVIALLLIIFKGR